MSGHFINRVQVKLVFDRVTSGSFSILGSGQVRVESFMFRFGSSHIWVGFTFEFMSYESGLSRFCSR